MNEELDIIQQIAVLALPLLFAITVHEAAHGWAAYRLGDNTAQQMGRVTLNPIKHIDLIGTVIMPLLILFISQFNFMLGWAKPVPVNFNRLKSPRRDTALVALAGPGANFLMAIGWAFVAKLGVMIGDQFVGTPFLFYMGNMGIFINVILMVLNLLPLLPLDGGRVLHSLLPTRLAQAFGQLEPYGFFILVILLLTHVLEQILSPPIQFISHKILLLVSL